MIKVFCAAPWRRNKTNTYLITAMKQADARQARRQKHFRSNLEVLTCLHPAPLSFLLAFSFLASFSSHVSHSFECCGYCCVVYSSASSNHQRRASVAAHQEMTDSWDVHQHSASEALTLTLRGVNGAIAFAHVHMLARRSSTSIGGL